MHCLGLHLLAGSCHCVHNSFAVRESWSMPPLAWTRDHRCRNVGSLETWDDDWIYVKNRWLSSLADLHLLQLFNKPHLDVVCKTPGMSERAACLTCNARKLSSQNEATQGCWKQARYNSESKNCFLKRTENLWKPFVKPEGPVYSLHSCCNMTRHQAGLCLLHTESFTYSMLKGCLYIEAPISEMLHSLTFCFYIVLNKQKCFLSIEWPPNEHNDKLDMGHLKFQTSRSNIPEDLFLPNLEETTQKAKQAVAPGIATVSDLLICL